MAEVEAARDGLRYQLLGPVEAYTEGGRISLGSPKQRAVLVVLLLRANTVVPDERLIAMIWGDRPPRSVRGRLQVHVSELRSVLGRDVIARTGQGYRISVGPGALDLREFLDAVEQAREELRVGAADLAARRLRGALRLWGGSALGGVNELLASQVRPGLEERRLSALEELYEAELAAGRHALVVGELREAVTGHPFRERLVAQLMLALYRCQRRPDALAVYAETRARLVEELGIEPGRALRDMQVRVLNDAEKTPVPASAREPARVAPVVPAELPRAVPDFTGRADGVAALDEALLGDGGIAVISGAAGMGKTALAVHWAHRARERFPEGQLYVNLRGFELDTEPMSPGEALGQLLRSLGVEPRQVPETVDEQAALYRSLLARHRMLVLLDNARDVQQIQPLLPASGSVVVTSRQRLTDLVASWGARTVVLNPLSDDEARALLEVVLGPERVAAEPDRVEQLAGLCAGLPFALRLAAARVPARGHAPIAAVVDELNQGDRLRVLTVDGTGRSAVAAAFAASYRALPADQQRLFRLLGLVPGPDFTPAAVAALAGVPRHEAARHLKVLTAAHMVERHAEQRYRLHDLIRLYAVGQAREDDDERRAWERLVEHYLAVASAIIDRDGPSILRLPSDRYPRSDRLGGDRDLTGVDPDLELPNLTAAVSRAAGRGPYPLAWFFVDDVRTCLCRRGRRTAWRRIAPLILDAGRRSGGPAVEALVHHSIGDLSFRGGERDEALRHLNDAVRLAHDCGWRECEAVARNGLGWVLGWTGRPADAVIHIQKAAAMFAEMGSLTGENRSLNNLGGQYHLLGKLDLAEDCYLQAHALSERACSRAMQTADLVRLGAIRGTQGRVAQAEADLARATEFFTAAGSTVGSAWAQTWLGRLHCETGNYERAHQDAIHALELARETGSALLEGTVLLVLADAEIGIGEHTHAEDHIQLSELMIGKGEFRLQMTYAYVLLARLRSRRGAYREAVGYAARALGSARECGYRVCEPAALFALTEAYLLSGETGPAAKAGREALALSRDIHLVHEERRLRRLLAK